MILNALWQVFAVLAWPGYIIALCSVGYFAVQAVEYLITRKMMVQIYNYRSYTINEIRAHLTLPALSVMLAILSGIGVNLATGGGGINDLSTGIQLIAIAVVMAIVCGFTLLQNSSEPLTPSRELHLRLVRVSEALDDPFVSVERAVQLLPEMRRHAAVGRRLMQRAEQVTYRDWRASRLTPRHRRQIRWAWWALLIWVPLAVVRLAIHGWDSSAAAVMACVVGAGMSCGVVAPRLHFSNERRRWATFGMMLANGGDRIVREIARLDRMQRSQRPSSLHTARRRRPYVPTGAPSVSSRSIGGKTWHRRSR